MPNNIPDKVLKDLHNQLGSKKEMTHLVLMVRDIILRRTRAWRDVSGHRREPYSERYRMKRIEEGLAVAPAGRGTDSLMVWDSYGGMMSKIRPKYIRKGLMHLDIVDARKKEIAYFHNVSGVGKRGAHLFKFWGVSPKEEKLVLSKAGQRMGVILAELTKTVRAGP